MKAMSRFQNVRLKEAMFELTFYVTSEFSVMCVGVSRCNVTTDAISSHTVDIGR
jgi:hypothetical protein